MRWLHNISFSSPSSSSSPLSDHPSSYNSRDRSNTSENYFNHNTNRINLNLNNNNNTNNNSTHGNNNESASRGPRLTRQKKLRHLRNQEFIRITKFSQTDNMPESITLSRSNSGYDQFSSPFKSLPPSSSSGASAATAQPLPLPLPLPVKEESGESRLLSPREAGGNRKGVEEKEREGFRDRDRVDGGGEAVSPTIRRLLFFSFLLSYWSNFDSQLKEFFILLN